MDQVRILTRALTALAGIVGLAAGAVGSLAAQSGRPHRSGLWGELGGGPASLRMGCASCDDVVTAGGSGGHIRIGGVISDHVLLGWESAGFSDESFGFAPDDPATIAEMESTGLVVMWFPGRRGLFLKGGVSVAQGRFLIPTAAAQVDSVRGTGVGVSFGVGWDVSLSRKFAITVSSAAYVTAIGDLLLPSGRVDDVIGTMYHLSLAFTFR
jgi:hypothetical protein